MKQRIVTTFLLFVSLYKSEDVFSQQDQFGQIIYQTPAGWAASKFQDGVAILPSPLPPGEKLFIQLLQAKNSFNSLEEAFRLSYDEECAFLRASKMTEVSGKNYTSREVKRSFKGWEYIRGSGGIQISNGTPYPDEYGLELFVIRVNNRFERIAIVQSRNNCGALSRYYPSERLNYKRAIEQFLFSLEFTDMQAAAIKRAAREADENPGVWQGLSMTVGSAMRGAELGAGLKVQQLILFSNGQAYFGKNFPSEGLDELNTWIAAENNRRDWGVYHFDKSKGVIKMPYAEIPVQIQNEKLILTTNNEDHSFIKLQPVNEVKWSGTYVLREQNGVIPKIVFSADGKFTDNGALKVLFHEYIDCLNPALNPGAGTYTIKNHSAIFQYNDGRKIKIAVTGGGFNPGDPSPKEIILSFNEDKLIRQ